MKNSQKTTGSAKGVGSGTSSLNHGTFSAQMVYPNSNEAGENSEQEELIALGHAYAACFDSAMDLTAKRLKLHSLRVKSSVEVGHGQNADGRCVLDLNITAYLPSMAREDAQRLVDATYQICPYSNATCGNIIVRLHIKTEGT